MGIKSRLKISLLSLIFLWASTGTGAEVIHILARGETLYSLAREYGVTLDDLLRLNGILDPSDLSVGTRLVIPGEEDLAIPDSGTDYVTYRVSKGDTYYGIARMHGIAVDDLLKMNSRDASRVLRVGETLIVSAGQSASEQHSGGDTVVRQPVSRAENVPWWPVAGTKRPLDGKLVGVSISAEPQSYIHAVSTGQVVWTGPYRGFGNVVLVDSNGYIYLYGGNEDLFVNVGETVNAGSRIGRLGVSVPGGGSRDMIFSVFREGVPVSPDEAPRG
jgi:murein DD-endopeptidase MepM/ murein hydrolase activator NlpD